MTRVLTGGVLSALALTGMYTAYFHHTMWKPFYMAAIVFGVYTVYHWMDRRQPR
jgi:FtsH-binding integral membrane protein